MKKILLLVSGIVVFGLSTVPQVTNAQDLLPSDAYYRDTILVNEIAAPSPSLTHDDDVMPGGMVTGGGGFVGSGQNSSSGRTSGTTEVGRQSSTSGRISSGNYSSSGRTSGGRTNSGSRDSIGRMSSGRLQSASGR